jgi:hypothetical protein
VEFVDIDSHAPLYFFIPQDIKNKEEYEKGFSLGDIMTLNGTGIVTKRDELCIHLNKEDAYTAACDIINLDKSSFYSKYNLPKDVRDWRYEWALADIKKVGLRRNW